MRLMERFSILIAYAIVFSFIPVYSNPVAVTQFVLLSEVQVIDSTHWTIEFIFSKTPLQSDTFTNQFYLVGKGINPQFRPTIPVSKNGYGLIIPQQYPTLRLHAGDTVKMRSEYWNANDTMSTWQCTIDRNITPTQSMAALQFIDDYSGTGGGKNVPNVQWCKDASPTIGRANDSIGIYGRLQGFVCDKDSNPIPNFQIFYYDPFPGYHQTFQTSISSDSVGCFYFTKLLSTYKLNFFSIKYHFTVSPFSIEPDSTVYVTCKSDNYTSTYNPPTEPRKQSLKILSILEQPAKSVLVVFNGHNNTDDYSLGIYNAAGKTVFTSRISNTGSGTYSVACARSNGKGISSGVYIARISSQSTTIEKRFAIK